MFFCFDETFPKSFTQRKEVSLYSKIIKMIFDGTCRKFLNKDLVAVRSQVAEAPCLHARSIKAMYYGHP
jgi:hypothetical protein